jgi:hypothetical protein
MSWKGREVAQNTSKWEEAEKGIALEEDQLLNEKWNWMSFMIYGSCDYIFRKSLKELKSMQPIHN